MSSSFERNKLRHKKKNGKVVVRSSDFSIALPKDDILLKTAMVESFMYEKMNCNQEEVKQITQFISILTKESVFSRQTNY